MQHYQHHQVVPKKFCAEQHEEWCYCLGLRVFTCTSAGFPAGELKLDASVQLQGDEAVCRHHEDPGDQEEQQQQGHIPGRGRSTRKRWVAKIPKNKKTPGIFRELRVACFKRNTCVWVWPILAPAKIRSVPKMFLKSKKMHFENKAPEVL